MNGFTRTFVTLDGEHVYRAWIALDQRGYIQRWNGFIAYPLFSFDVFQTLIADLVAGNGANVEDDRFVWEQRDGKPVLLRFRYADDLTRHHRERDDEVIYRLETIRETSHIGFWSIGGFEWTWSEVEDHDDPSEIRGDFPETVMRALHGDR